MNVAKIYIFEKTMLCFHSYAQVSQRYKKQSHRSFIQHRKFQKICLNMFFQLSGLIKSLLKSRELDQYFKITKKYFVFF
jgi:hypothetical protein